MSTTAFEELFESLPEVPDPRQQRRGWDEEGYHSNLEGEARAFKLNKEAELRVAQEILGRQVESVPVPQRSAVFGA